MSYSFLIVESSTTVRASLKRIIRQTNYGCGRIFEAQNGDEVSEVLAHQHVDMILIDPTLPEVDGLELIGRIRAEPDTRNIPVVAMGGRLDNRRTEQLRRCGVRGQLPKPFTPEAFANVVVTVLEPTHV